MQLFTPEQETLFISGLKAKREDVFDEFYSHTKPLIYGILYKRFPYRMGSEIDDISQEFFLKVWNKIDTFKEDCKLATWIYRIATNIVIDRISRNKHFNNCESLDAALEAGVDFESKSPIGNEKTASRVSELKNCLGKTHLAVFSMVFEQGKSVKEVSKELNIPIGTVVSRNYYLKRKIKEKLFTDKNEEKNSKL